MEYIYFRGGFLYTSKLMIEKTIKKHLFKKMIRKKLEKQNNKYINQKLKENKDFFDNINGYSLDEEQRKIIVSEEDSALVIAGAGSGKTLTIIGRILYLIKQGISPSDILVISFTKEASNNLKKTLIKNNANINVMTFHKLGRKILKENNMPVNLVNEEILKKIINKNINEANINIMIPDLKFITYGDNMEDLQRIIMLNSDEVKSLKKLFLTFINLFKSSNYELKDFDNFLKEKKEGYFKDKHQAFLKLAKQIYQDYTYYLNKNRQIDFHDMINQSINIIKDKGIYNYKYIIIDEYQDTSLVKCQLIKTIQRKTNSKLLAVGDDFQSIYRFTGTNIKVFTEFEKYFPNSKIFKLEKTYRNSEELLKITTKFILKNKNQITKKLWSEKHHKNPLYIYYYNDNMKEVLEKIIKELKSKKYLILGRNNKDIKNIKYKAMTVHKSKGLEADNIIIVNLEDKIDGFPNKITNDKVLKYVLKEEDKYPYEEERRLFYVALTRTKNSNYLLVNIKKPSLFVQEIIKDNSIKIINEKDFCPCCKQKLKKVKEGQYYICNNYPKCKYKKIDKKNK